MTSISPQEARKIIGDCIISDLELNLTIEALSGLIDLGLDDYFDLEERVEYKYHEKKT